jgi:hypothetical protein
LKCSECNSDFVVFLISDFVNIQQISYPLLSAHIYIIYCYVPAKLGARSCGLAKQLPTAAPLNPRLSIRHMMEINGLQLNSPTKNKKMAGTRWAVSKWSSVTSICIISSVGWMVMWLVGDHFVVLYIYIYMCVCVCVYTHTRARTPTYIHTHTQTNA